MTLTLDKNLWEARLRALSARNTALTTVSAFALAACGDGGGGGGEPAPEPEPEPNTFNLTSGQDTVPGDEENGADDTINGALSVNGGFQTLNSEDVIDGGDGFDTLFAAYTEPLTPLSITNVEKLILTDADADPELVNLVGVTGLEELELRGNAGDAPIININDIVTLSLVNNTRSAMLDYTPAAVVGDNDVQVVTLNASTFGALMIDEGIEEVEITSEGPVANHMEGSPGLEADGATKLTIDGDQDLTIAYSLSPGIQTINAAGFTGDLDLTQNNPGKLAVTLGSGDDRFHVGDGLDGSDVINGGAGMNTLVASASALAGLSSLGGILNFDDIEVESTTPLTQDLDFTLFPNVDTLSLLGGVKGPVTLTLNSGDEVTLGDDVYAGTLTLGIGTDGGNDLATLNLWGSDFDGFGVGLDASLFERVILVTSDDDPEDADNVIVIDGPVELADPAGFQTLTIRGDEKITFLSPVLADRVDASELTDSLALMGLAEGASIGDSEVIGSTRGDTLNMNDDLASSIDGRSGNDFIGFDLNVSDVVTGGPGNDVFRTEDGASYDGADPLVGSTITDLGTSDTLQISVGALNNRLGDTGEEINQGDGVTEVVATNSTTFDTVDADGTMVDSGDIILITGKTFATAAAVLDDISAGDRSFTLDAAIDDNDGVIIAYQISGGSTQIAAVQINGDSDSSADFDAIEVIVTLNNVDVDDLDTYNIDIIA